jgi:two-component system, LytTR family, sensor kinase
LNIKKTVKIEIVLPLLLAFLLPGLSFLNNEFFLKQHTLFEIANTWVSSFIFLLIIWYVNEWLYNKKVPIYYLIVVVLNISLVFLFILFTLYIFPKNISISSWVVGLRVLLVSAVFIVIQQSLRSAKMVEKLKSEILSLKIEKYKAELDQLRKQVNPHFLFNSLSSLRMMIRSEDPNSEQFLIKLSSLYRQVLHAHSSDYVALEREYELLDAYIYLMKIRHRDALHVTTDMNRESYHCSIPIYALQLLVENCIKHNVVSARKPLFIHIYQEDELSVTVSNTYQPKQQPMQSTGVGLSNLLERYRLMGVDDGVKIVKTKDNYKVTIKLFYR